MKKLLHKGGHGCCGGTDPDCCANHKHHEHKHCHEHEHAHKSLNAEQTLVLLDYTLGHNRDHLGELGDIEASLRKMEKSAAADAVHNSIHHFEKAIEELENALKAAKE